MKPSVRHLLAYLVCRVIDHRWVWHASNSTRVCARCTYLEAWPAWAHQLAKQVTNGWCPCGCGRPPHPVNRDRENAPLKPP